MKKSSSLNKKPVWNDESEETSFSDEECSGSELEYSDNQIEQAEEMLEDVEVSGEETVSESNVSSEEELSDAVETTNEDETQSGSEEECDEETQRTVFIKDIGYDLREDDLRQQMQRLGEVIRVTIPMTHDLRRNKGFAYVEFKRLADAQKALKLDGTELLGRKVAVFQAKPRENRKIYTLFVKNLSYTTTKSELKEYFERFGKIYNISLPVDNENTERNKGFCFIEYTEPDPITRALKGKHTLNERTLYVIEGNKNEDRNKKRSTDRLYGRSKNTNSDESSDISQSSHKSRFQKENKFNSKGDKNKKFDDSKKSSGKGKFEKRPQSKSFSSQKNPNKIVFDDSE
ncbi:uncharacterized protein VICG_01280 [Vittaforma corneae ATCC 50505]|uniref:RRM domain-containing protein n=1 Tax=Vittaforma corneae (strain ATCC 50505) TaxID=993615 RepID=L2GMX2_VITCO|nr:uncharacterized protein VICG_01280 [Vittaforma corneae ATCC 50505]ELA41647.1 hypothetical protein VICG_01280 [Vittaforma corneae ATCC 50505]